MTHPYTRWRHQVETFSALLAICAGNSPVPSEFPAQRPVTRSFDVIFDMCPKKRLSKQWWGWWFETPPCPLWRHCNDKATMCLFHLALFHIYTSVNRVGIDSDNDAYLVPCHYLNQCQAIVNWTLTNKLQLNYNQSTNFPFTKKTSSNFVCEMAAILSR